MTDTAKTATKQIKSKQRVANHGEVFTNDKEVNAMLDLLPNTIWQASQGAIQKTFLEPACGNGNFLAKILDRKLAMVLALINIKKITKKHKQASYEFYAILAVSSIYGIELLSDNCTECRNRLLDLFVIHYQNHFKNTNKKVIDTAKFLLTKNIVCGNALTLLDLDNKPIVFSEYKTPNLFMIQRRDYRYENLVEKIDNHSPNQQKFIAKPIKQDYKTIHFLELSEQDNE